jgi:hypothetical protein
VSTETAEESFWSLELERFLPSAAQALDEALEYVGCPVCYVLASVPYGYFALLPKRWEDEPDLRDVVRRAGGFCNRHTWRLSGMQSLVAIARVYMDILEAYPTHHRPGDRCPVCLLQELMEGPLVDGFLQWLGSAANQRFYSLLLGLCYRHYERVMERPDLDPALRELLAQTQEARRKELIRHLHGFLEKNTIEGKWTRTEAENRAPRHALLNTAGNEEA